MEKQWVYIHKDNIVKKIHLDEELPKGFTYGNPKANTTQGRKCYTNGIVNRYLNPDTDFVPEGFYLGKAASLKSKEAGLRLSLHIKNHPYRWYNNGIECRRCEIGTQPQGWLEGKLPMTPELKEKLTGIKHTISKEGYNVICRSNRLPGHNNRKKAKQTIIKNYGSLDNFFKYIHEKGNLSKVARKTFNTSKPEDICYLYLKTKFDKVLRHYKDKERYPFYCDFYIPSNDLFIELNLHWTHGSQPYDSLNSDCLLLLEEWQEKAKTSLFYKNAIETWTVRDVEKLKVATMNNLNYKVLYVLNLSKLGELLETPLS